MRRDEIMYGPDILCLLAIGLLFALGLLVVARVAAYLLRKVVSVFMIGLLLG
jgi:hypothetical protein